MPSPLRLRGRVAIAVALLLSASSASAAVYRVGPGCQYPDLAAAFIGAATDTAPEMRLSGDQTVPVPLIQARRITLIGGYADCSATTPSGHSLVSGSGGARTSVLRIRGQSQVRLERLWIAFGDDTDEDDNGGEGGGHGGGIDFRGSGSLDLVDTAVFNNEADYGGGMNLQGDAALAVTLGARTRIYNNTARVSGGGIRIEGRTTLRMIEEDSAIFGNLADGGAGGGLQILGPASADIGSPGIQVGSRQRGAFHDNVAEYGGGIAIVSLRDHGARARLFGTDAEHPVRLEDNRARRSGGALWLKPYRDFGSQELAKVCLDDFRLDANSAMEGAAIYADAGTSLATAEAWSVVSLNRSSACGGLPGDAGATRCRAGPGCNVIDHNLARDANDVPTGGAIVLMQTDSSLFANRTQWYRNQGGSLLRGVEAGVLDFDGCAMSGNVSSGPLLRANDPAPIELRHCTLAANQIGGAVAISSESGVIVHDSILYEAPGVALIGGGTRDVMHVLASERATLDGGNSPYVREGDPRFMDPEHLDLRLQAASPAIDSAPASSQPERDLDGAPRDQDLPGIDYSFGPRDLGAYERQEIGNLVLNPDFPLRDDGDELRRWNIAGATTDVVWSATEGLGSVPGSVFLAFDPQFPPTPHRDTAKGSTHYFGMNQCVHLPLPAVYLLTAATKMPGNFSNQDYARLVWSLHPDDASCSGAPQQQGEASLARSSGWATQPGQAISVPAGLWTSNSSLRITMMLEPNPNGGATNIVSGYFDRVSLIASGLPPPSGPLFRDGFED